AWIARAWVRTSATDQRSKAKRIAPRSRARNKPLMCRPKLSASPEAGVSGGPGSTMLIGRTRAREVDRQLEHELLHVCGLRIQLYRPIERVAQVGQRSQDRRAQSGGERLRMFRRAALVEGFGVSNQVLNSCHHRTRRV